MKNINNFISKIERHLHGEFEKLIELNKLFIVLEVGNEINSEKPNLRNVICFNIEGNVIWRIAIGQFIGHAPSPYSNIYIENSKLYVYHPTGIELNIDPLTGNIISMELIK